MVLAIALIYYVALSLIAGLIMRKKVKTATDFVKSSAGLSWPLITFGFVLIPLGAGHTLSLWEQAGVLGASVVWWGILTGGVFVPLMMLWLGPWVRQSGLQTFPAIIERIFGKELGWLHSAVQIAAWTGIGASEVLAGAAAIYGLTDGSVAYAPWCILISLGLTIIYIYFGGIMQMAWMNIVNACVLIFGSYLGLGMLITWVGANAGGLEGIKAVFESSGQSDLLSSINFGPELFFQVIIPVVVLHCAAGAVAQNMNSLFFAARSDSDCRKGVFYAAAINCMACVPWVLTALIGLGLARMGTFPGITEDAKLVVFQAANVALPKPVVAIMCISLLAAVLSSCAAHCMGNANMLTTDIINRAMFPNMNDTTRLKVMRWMILVCALLFAVPALTVPVVFPVFLWAFSFGIPVFVCYILGMVYKISRPAAWITIIVSYIVDFIWTFWTPSWASGPFALNMYPVTVVSVILGIVLTLVLPGEPGLLKQQRAKAAADANA